MQTLTNTVDVSTSLINGFSRTQYGFSPNMFYIVHLIYPFKFEPGVKYQTNQIIDIFFKNQHHLWIDKSTLLENFDTLITLNILNVLNVLNILNMLNMLNISNTSIMKRDFPVPRTNQPLL